MKYLHGFIIPGLLTYSIVQADDNSKNLIDQLKALDFGYLTEIEVSLDDVFDIFGGLIERQDISTASGVRQSADMAPSVTTVITAQDIEAIGARTLAEVLKMVPGLSVGRFTNNLPIYTVRGIYSSENFEILMLINGVPLKSAFNGNRSLYDYSPLIQHIDRIEVVRGPGSAVYGADALSGVINIITKSADEINGTEAGLQLSSFDTQDAWVLHGSRIGDVDVVAAVQYSSTDGPNRIIDEDLQTLFDKAFTESVPGLQPVSAAPGVYNTGLSKWNGHLDLRYDLWQLQLNYHATQDAENGVLALVLDSEGRNDTSYFGTNLKWHNPTLTPTWDMAATLSYKHFLGDSSLLAGPPGSIRFGPCGDTEELCIFQEKDGVKQIWTINEQQARLELAGIYSGFKDHSLRIGAGYVLEDLYKSQNLLNSLGIDRNGNLIQPNAGIYDVTGTDFAYYPPANRTNWSLFLQDTWHFLPDWQFTTGMFYNKYSDLGSITSPRAALAWQVNDRLTARFLYGKAFRAPTFLEQFVSQTIIRGNPNLSPETIDNYELAFDYRLTGRFYTSLSLFHYEIRDKILPEPPKVFNPAAPFLHVYTNAGEWKGNGLEIETRWKISDRASLLFNYSYVDNNTLTADRGLYPHHQAYLRTDWLFYPRWYLNTQLLWVADRMRVETDNRPAISDYTTLDLAVRYKDAGHSPWNIAFGIRNAFDADVREPTEPEITNDLPQAGRSFFGEIRYHFD